MAMGLPQALGLALGSCIFLVLAVWIPACAATMAGRASLGLTGRPIISTALTLERFGQMATGAWQGAQRVISPMLRRG